MSGWNRLAAAAALIGAITLGFSLAGGSWAGGSWAGGGRVASERGTDRSVTEIGDAKDSVQNVVVGVGTPVKVHRVVNLRGPGVRGYAGTGRMGAQDERLVALTAGWEAVAARRPTEVR